jgi:hypothetical protein
VLKQDFKKALWQFSVPIPKSSLSFDMKRDKRGMKAILFESLLKIVKDTVKYILSSVIFFDDIDYDPRVQKQLFFNFGKIDIFYFSAICLRIFLSVV